MRYFLQAFFVLLSFVQLIAQNENPASMKDWKYPYEVQYVTVSDSIDIAYVDEGKGKCTLLFLHGLGSNLKAWQKNIEGLKEKYRCIALDLPGYGKSEQAAYPFDMTFFAKVVHQCINKLELNKVVLVGHSMGGQIAMHTILNRDKKIEKLILIAPAGFETFSDEEKGWFQNIFTPAIVKATPESRIIKNFHLNFHEFPEDAQFMIDDRMLMRQSAGYDYYCNMIPKCVTGMLNEPVFEHLSEIKTPTLILFGENDSLIPNQLLHPKLSTLEVAQSGYQKITGSELEMIPMAGHFVQWEQAEKVNQRILDFLK